MPQAKEISASAETTIVAKPDMNKRSTQKIGSFEVPYAHEVWADGVYHIDELPDGGGPDPTLNATPDAAHRASIKIISHEPLWIRRFGRTLDTQEQLVELAFADSITHEVRTEWVNRLQLADKRKLVQLARVGIAVNDGNVSAMMAYLDHALHINGPKLPVVLVAARTGAYELEYGVINEAGFTEKRQGWGWLVGDRWIGPDGTKVTTDPRSMNQNSRGFACSGDEGKWFAKFQELCEKGPVARWLLYSTFAAPLLRFVKQRTFIIHHFGDTGGGKTATGKFAMSAWGDPVALTQTFNRTALSFVELFRYMDDVPVMFDELQASGVKDHAAVIYSLCLEKGRGRATREGELQKEIESWRSIVRMTGEEPIIGKGGIVDLGGQANRVVQIGTPVLSSEEALGVHRWLEDRNFGWGGVRFLERLEKTVECPDGAELLLAKFNALHDTIIDRTESVVHSRGLHLATVALAQYLANRWFFDMSQEGATEIALADAVAVAQSIANEEIRESLTEQALQVLRDNFAARRNSWYDLTDVQQQEEVARGSWRSMTGILASNEVWLIQKEANIILARAGLPPRRVWTDFKRYGILMTHDGQSRKEFGVSRRYGRFHSKVYVLRRDLCGPFTGEDICE